MKNILINELLACASTKCSKTAQEWIRTGILLFRTGTNHYHTEYLVEFFFSIIVHTRARLKLNICGQVMTCPQWNTHSFFAFK